MTSPQAGFETKASASAGSMVPTLRGCSKCSWMMSEYCTASLPWSESATVQMKVKGRGPAAQCQGESPGHTRYQPVWSHVRDCSARPRADTDLAHPWPAIRVKVRANQSYRLSQ